MQVANTTWPRQSTHRAGCWGLRGQAEDTHTQKQPELWVRATDTAGGPQKKWSAKEIQETGYMHCLWVDWTESAGNIISVENVFGLQMAFQSKRGLNPGICLHEVSNTSRVKLQTGIILISSLPISRGYNDEERGRKKFYELERILQIKSLSRVRPGLVFWKRTASTPAGPACDEDLGESAARNEGFLSRGDRWQHFCPTWACSSHSTPCAQNQHHAPHHHVTPCTVRGLSIQKIK